MCKAAKVAVQVLGSGGPIAEAGRAGTSYLYYVDGLPRVLIDSGPGAFLRFAEAGAKVATLQAIALSHLHADHSVDLAGIINTSRIARSKSPLSAIRFWARWNAQGKKE